MMISKKIPILMYHSIELMPRSTVMRGMHVPPRRFKFQMWLLKILGYKGLSIRELQPYLDGIKVGKVVGITFDDGYQNNLINAAPILNKYKFSATCYLVSNYIGVSNVWDKSKGLSQRPLMTIPEVKEWISLGMDIGAHTLSHVDLKSSSKDIVKNEINLCKAILEKKFNITIMDFCYPFGSFDEATCSVVKKAGYTTATTMIRGRASIETSHFQLPRVPITFHTLPYLFLVKIFTNYEDRKFKN